MTLPNLGATFQSLVGSVANRRFSSALEFRARLLAEEVSLRRGLDEFQGLYATRAVLYPHQVAVAHQVLTGNPKGAVLADEVGLGKTIEAGLVLKELRLRGKAESVLIAAPQHLLGQWAGELREKFDLESVVLDREERRRRDLAGEDWWGPGITLVSLPLLSRLDAARLRALRGARFDVLVVDEAHRVRNRNGKAHRALREVRRDRTLLLTATPIQTRLSDLFSLLELVDPFALTEGETEALGGDEPDPERLERLRPRLSGLLIRNRRADVRLAGLVLPERSARTFPFELPEDERSLREAVNTYARVRHAAVGQRGSFDLIALERLMASHPRALEEGLRRRLRRAGGDPGVDEAVDLAPEGDEVGGELTGPVDAAVLSDLVFRVSRVPEAEKANRLAAFLRELFEERPEEKVLVFSEFLDTIRALQVHLAGEGHRVHAFHGGLSPQARRDQLAEFWASGQVLLLSDAGSEGQNLQRAHILVNFDLPWNPMRIEQRIGRIHRIGQTRPVEVLNFVAAGTIEERLVSILQRRINLFTEVVGDLDAIMGELEGGAGLEELLLRLALAEPEVALGLAEETEERVREVANQYRLAEGLDRRVLEHFDLSLRERYFELDARVKAGLDHLPLRRFLRAAADLADVPWNPDAETFTLDPAFGPLTLRPDIAADGEADLVHPLHPAVTPLLASARQAGEVGWLRLAASRSGMIFPPEAFGRRGLLFFLKASWEGDAADERLVPVFVDEGGRVWLELADLATRAELEDAPDLPVPGLDELRSALSTLEAALPAVLEPDRARLRGEAERRFEALARNVEAHYAEQLDRLEVELMELGRQNRNARLDLHHTADPELRRRLRAGLGELEVRRDRRLRELADGLMSLATERDRRVAAEQAMLRLEERVELVSVAVAEIS